MFTPTSPFQTTTAEVNAAFMVPDHELMEATGYGTLHADDFQSGEPVFGLVNDIKASDQEGHEAHSNCIERDRAVKSEGGENGAVSYGVAWTIGFRPSMEDAHMVDLSVVASDSPNLAMFCVFDGHRGNEVAEFCAKRVKETFAAAHEANEGKDLGDTLRSTFIQLDKQVMQCIASNAGTTATVAIYHRDELVVAGVGDTRCLLLHNGQQVRMTVDHKPNDPPEATRIYRAGGFVAFGRVGADINMSRSLGDSMYKDDKSEPHEQMISPVPDIRKITLGADHRRIMVLACDGVWNSMTDREVSKYVGDKAAKGFSMEQIARGLAKQCMSPERTAGDNITAILVEFHLS